MHFIYTLYVKLNTLYIIKYIYILDNINLYIIYYILYRIVSALLYYIILSFITH